VRRRWNLVAVQTKLNSKCARIPSSRHHRLPKSGRAQGGGSGAARQGRGVVGAVRQGGGGGGAGTVGAAAPGAGVPGAVGRALTSAAYSLWAENRRSGWSHPSKLGP
jgi:hypothetical protein